MFQYSVLKGINISKWWTHERYKLECPNLWPKRPSPGKKRMVKKNTYPLNVITLNKG
jgi:hypothetical protein